MSGGVALAATVAGMAPAHPNHPDETTSAAIYRIPYADGTLVDVIVDAHNHGGMGGNRDRIDFAAVDAMGNRIAADVDADVDGDGDAAADAGDPFGLIVAAASGTIAVIQDGHGNDYGRGDGQAADGTAHDDSVEHLCTNNAVLPAGEACPRHNNYVWIAHPNGEWTKYSHFRTGTVTLDRNWAVGDSVLVGDVLGEEGNVGFAFSTHLHFEVANLGPYEDYDTNGDGVPETLPANIGSPGGFISTATFENHNARACDGASADYEYVDDNDGSTALTAGDCVNTAPVADAGGDYVLEEGSTVTLDGTGSSDIHNAVLSYSWNPGTNLDDPASPTPMYTAVDDTVEMIELTVSDVGGDVSAVEALSATDTATVTVENVAPTVSAVGDSIDEGSVATVSAAFTDPGMLDTHTASIDWGDGTAAQPVSTVQLTAGVEHPYGDNGVFDVTVTVTDDDGGIGMDVTTVTVANLDPEVTLDVSGQISFPGGDYFVTGAGDELPLSAAGSDAGSDDLTFAWSTGDVTTYFNDPSEVPDPLSSPLGTYPFAAADMTEALSPTPGAELLTLTLSDDDGGSDSAEAGVVIVGTASTTEGLGWWKHQLSGAGVAHVDPATLAGYLEVVEAVSGVFSEAYPAGTFEEAHALLSSGGGSARARAVAELLVAWLQFASGAVPWDATVPVGGGATVDFLDLMFTAEETIVNQLASSKQLGAVERDLARVRHAT